MVNLVQFSAIYLKLLAITVNVLFCALLFGQDTMLVDVMRLDYPVRMIANDSTGQIWLAGGEGLQIWGEDGFETVDATYDERILGVDGAIIDYSPEVSEFDNYPWELFTTWKKFLPPTSTGYITAATNEAGQVWVASGNYIFIFQIDARFEKVVSGHSTRGILLADNDLYVNTYVGILKNGVIISDSIAEGNILPWGDRIVFADAGLLYYSPVSGQFSRSDFLHMASDEEHPDTIKVNVICEWEGTIWAATSKGLAYLEGDSLVPVTETLNIESMLAEEDRLILGTMKNGVLVWDQDGLRSLDFDASIRYVDIAYQNPYYYFATDSGLVVWDGNDTRHLTINNGLSNNAVTSCVPDKYGRIWLSTYSGLDRYEPENDFFRHYLPQVEFNRNSLYATDSVIYMGSINGVYAFHPQDFLIDEIIAPKPVDNSLLWILGLASLLVVFVAAFFYQKKLNRRKVALLEESHNALQRRLFLMQIESLVQNSSLILNVNELASEMGLSERGLYRKLQKYNVTPGEVIKKARLKKAKRMVEVSGKSLKDAAQEVGYTEHYLRKLLEKEPDHSESPV